MGVRHVEAVVHTHHHRDQCGGDDRAVARGIPIWVPARERALFEANDAFWRLRRTYDSYDTSSGGFSRVSPLPVARGLADHERLSWAGGQIEVLPTPGHTKGSISLLAEVDGIPGHSPGTSSPATGPSRPSTTSSGSTARRMPSVRPCILQITSPAAGRGLLLPSHGSPIHDGQAALAALVANLRDLARLHGEMPAPSAVDHMAEQRGPADQRVLPHLWVNATSLANSWALVDDDGDALDARLRLPLLGSFLADQRFVAHTIDVFRAEAGLRKVVAAVPSHYHDDHLAGVPWLQREMGAQAWIHESFAELSPSPSASTFPAW